MNRPDTQPEILLAQGLSQLAIDLSHPQQQQLLEYGQLLHKWNRVYNLTAIRDPEEMVKLHLLDSLTVLPWLHDSRYIDVGTGAGLPGIPLAIARPDWHITLLDTNGKKTRFLQHVKAVLGLSNVTVVQARVEAFHPDELFSGVLTRAFSSLLTMVDVCQHLLAQGGAFWAMKGQCPQAEIAQLQAQHCIVHSHPLTIPGVAAERWLVEVRQVL